MGAVPLLKRAAMPKNFAILRTQKLKAAVAVRRSLKHAFREQDTPNADPQLRDQNSHFGASNVDDAMAKFNALMPDKVRKNGVRCIEYLITASPNAMNDKNRSEQDGYFQDALEWLKDRHGADCVFYAGIHRDETTPHMYAYVVPLDGRKKLNCRHFLGGADALRTMQTDFADRVGKRHGLDRGIEGSKAKHTTVKQYYANLNQSVSGEIPRVRVNSDFLDNKLLSKTMFTSSYETDTDRDQRVENAINNHIKQIVEPYKAKAQQAIESAQEADLRTKQAIDARAEAERLKSRYGALEFVPAADLSQLLERGRVNQEITRRIADIPKMVRRATGAAASFFRHAHDLIKSNKSPSAADWHHVEIKTIVEGLGNKRGESEIRKALNDNSPLRVTDARKAETLDLIFEVQDSPDFARALDASRRKPDRGYSR